MKLVLIEWLDSHSGNGWRRISEIQEDGESVRCRSVGWLVSEGDGHAVIVPHLSGEADAGVVTYGNGDLSIPEAAIVSMQELATG